MICLLSAKNEEKEGSEVKFNNRKTEVSWNNINFMRRRESKKTSGENSNHLSIYKTAGEKNRKIGKVNGWENTIKQSMQDTERLDNYFIIIE